VTNDDAELATEHDGIGRVASFSQTFTDEFVPQSPYRQTVEHLYEHDMSGRMTALSGEVLDVTYGYDGAGRLNQVSVAQCDGMDVTLYRDGMGRIVRQEYGSSGVSTMTVYGRRGQPKQKTTLKATQNGPVVLLSFAYTYDHAGRLTGVVDVGANTVERTYTYDGMSRLSGATYDYPSPAPDKKWGYTYNLAGDRLSECTGTTSCDSTSAYTWDAQTGHLTDVDRPSPEADEEYTFDDAGNLTLVVKGAAETVHTYDKRGRLSSLVLPDDSEYEYRYGPDERRTVQVGPSVTTRYFHDGRVAYEMSNDGHVLRAYVFMPDGYTPLLMIEYGEGEAVDGCYAYHNDHLSTPRAMTDDSGAVIWRASLAPFGQRIGACDTDQDGADDDACPVDQPLRFPGQWDDAGTGLYYNWHRYYVPGCAIYSTQDPLVLKGVEEKRFAGFSYADGGPTRATDPTGLREWYDNAADVFFGYTDSMSFGATQWARDAIGFGDVPNPDSAAYTAGEVGALLSPACLGLGAFKAGWRFKIGMHPPHHGKGKHIGAVIYNTFVKGSHKKWSLPWPPWR